MAAAGVDERWCLGDLVGREPVTAELVGAASQLDLLIAGNHDAWALGPDRVVARGRDVFRLSSRALASRHGIDCWHGSPRHPLLGFLTEASAARILPGRPLGSLGLVGHTHEPALFVYDGAATRAVRPVPGESYDWLATGAFMANPGAVCGNPRDAASWWLIVDIDARVMRWAPQDRSGPKKLPLPACEACRAVGVPIVVGPGYVTGMRHRAPDSAGGQRCRRSARLVPQPVAPVPTFLSAEGIVRADRRTCVIAAHIKNWLTGVQHRDLWERRRRDARMHIRARPLRDDP